jgi:aldehyde:ferredoxin oxidoreductase
MNTGGTIAFAMECYENGLITKKDTDGIELTWGNADAVVAITEKIARREGFGAVLADGVGKAAERIGKGSENYAIAVLGQSLAYHDPRMGPALGTAMIADANPAHHMDCQITAQLEAGASVGNDPALQTPKLDPLGDFDQKGPMYAIGSKFHQLFNAAGLCALYTVGSTVPVAELIEGVTGWNFGWPEALKAGHRILTLRQAFNAREGITPDKFEMPRRIKEELLKTGPCAGAKIDFEALRKGYFDAMGWDIKSGKPLPETLKKLELDELTGDL